MNRCSGYTKNNNKCRAKTKDNKLFCCNNHEPLNKELIDNCCFMCMEKVNKSNDIIFFQCKHAFHKSCYSEWLTFSKYEDKICIICRKNVLPNEITKSKKNQRNTLINTTKISNISNILNIHSPIAYNTGNSGYIDPFIYNTGPTGPTGPIGPISYNIESIGPISYTGHTGSILPISYNTGNTGPISYNTGNTGPISYNTGNTGPISYNTGHTGNTGSISYNIDETAYNYIIPNIIIPTEIILNIDEDY
jgi:hypothetical protein